MTTKTQHDDTDAKQGSDHPAKTCELCKGDIEGEDFYEKRFRTGGREYRHEDCHESVQEHDKCSDCGIRHPDDVCPDQPVKKLPRRGGA